MAALNTVDLSTETAAGSVDEKGVISTNTRLSSTNLLHRWGISVPDLPDIPDIPSPLMKPPKEQKIEAVTTGSVSLVGSTSIFSVPSDPLTRSSVLVGKHPVPEPSQRSADFGSDASRGHVSLDDLIRSQAGSHVEKVFASSLKDLQDHLAAKAHEVDKLRAEFQSMEVMNKEKDILSSIPWQSGNHTMRTTYSSHTNQHPGVSSSLSGPTRSVGLGSRTVGLPIPATGSTGIEFVVSQSAAQIEDLKKKLKLTTELCAKQDAYYREVVSGLENQLKESVAGRDHILALREKEAASQLQLIHQLEAAVRKQQQITATKEEALIAMESKMNQVENDVTAHKSISDKFKRILLDEEKKRFGSSLVTSALANSCAVGQIGDAMVEILQKCLFDDNNEKKTLKSNLDRVEAELKTSRELTESRQGELQKEYKARISKLEEDHRHELDSSSNRAAHARKELETLQDETDKLKQQHQTEVAAMEDKVKCLELELNRTRSSGRETAVNLETKAKELECRVRELSAELQILREEKEKLLMQFSQEQANVIAINEKLSRAENLRQEEAKKLQVLVKELSSLQKKYTEEVKGLKSDITGKESLLKELREEAIIQRESEVEKALKEEKEKSNTRLDGILNELTKSNNTVSALTSNLEATKLELSKLQRDNGKINENLKLTAKEVYLVREEKVKLTLHLEEKEKELSNTQSEVAELTSSLERQTKNLLEAKNLIEKLQTQLSEREKIIETFREQGSNLAEIIEKNSQTGDSLQREREQLVRTLEERIGEVEEMKNHREILAKKLRAKDKKLKELEEEKATLENSVKIKQEELDALMEDRSNIMAELKLRQIEVTKLKDENTSLNSLMEGKDGEREKEITKLLSRLKGSEQDLALTRKLLKTKGDMSGKAVRVAESMQKEVTTKRGELDTLQNKIHWLKENLDTATKDARYYERKRSELAVTVDELTVERDQLDYELRKVQEQSEEYRKQLNHMEQALEKAALKHADSQGAIEKMEQEMARLKLKHSLEIKELERNSKTASFSIKPEAAAPLLDLLMKLNGGLRWPPLTSQVELGSVLMSRKNAVSHPLQTLLPPAKESHTAGAEQESEMKSGHLPQQVSDTFSKKNGDVTEDLKTLLHEVRSLICSFQAHSSQPVTPAGTQGIASSWDGPQAERGPLRGGPRLYGKSDVDTPDQNVLAGDTVHKETHCGDKAARAERSNRYRFPKEGLQQKADSLESFTRAFEGSKVSTVTTDLNSRVSSNYGLDECGEDMDDILPPLHSSSPKKDIADSSELTDEHSGTRSANHSPLSLSFHSDDSDVTALLIDDQSTSTAETVIPRDSKISSLQGRVRSGASSVSSSHDSLSRTSSVASDVAEVLRKHVQPAPQTVKVGREHGDLLVTDRSATDKRKQTMAKSSRKAGGKEVSNRKTSSDSEPVYRRAEIILQSLAQTGEHLTKKNKEIEHLLKEQHKRIKKCRKNEDNIHALLT